MTFIWLIVWLIAGTPHVGNWNAWLISLLVCAGIDLFGSRARFS